MKFLRFLLPLSLLASANAKANTPIEHVVVLMLENRAFDHMLGYLTNVNPEIRGCTPETCSNPVDPSDPNSPRVPLTYDAVYQIASPCHEIHCVTEQIYASTAASNEGFISNFQAVVSNDTYARTVMDSFHPSHVPAIYNISQEFAVFDAYYSSVPGPTMVNRAYAASGTSHGMGFNDPVQIALGLPQKTMFAQLLDMGLDYKVYFQDVPSVIQHRDMRRHLSKYSRFNKFYDDVADGNLPQFAWLEPAYFEGPLQPASDQHPDHDVSIGDKLIKDVYESLRKSDLWDKTALIITYDEHGGFYDHAVPPAAPNPDGLNSTGADAFGFDRIGVRVPFIIASPWIPKGLVVHEPEGGGEYEHSSIIKSVVHELFSPEEGYERQGFLTERDEWAGGFGDVFNILEEPRDDCPMVLPAVEDHRIQFPTTLPKLDGMMALSDLQYELIDVVKSLDLSDDCRKEDRVVLLNGAVLRVEKDGYEWVKERMESCGIVISK
jgi:phospholipase C